MAIQATSRCALLGYLCTGGTAAARPGMVEVTGGVALFSAAHRRLGEAPVGTVALFSLLACGVTVIRRNFWFLSWERECRVSEAGSLPVGRVASRLPTRAVVRDAAVDR